MRAFATHDSTYDFDAPGPPHQPADASACHIFPIPLVDRACFPPGLCVPAARACTTPADTQTHRNQKANCPQEVHRKIHGARIMRSSRTDFDAGESRG